MYAQRCKCFWNLLVHGWSTKPPPPPQKPTKEYSALNWTFCATLVTGNWKLYYCNMRVITMFSITGSRFGPFPPIFPSVRPESNNWAIKPEPVSFSTTLYPPLQSYTKPRRQFPFLHGTSSDITFTGTFTSLPVDPASDCALSLLSSPVLSSPVQSSSSIVTTGTATNRIPMAQPLLSGFQFGASSGITGANGFTERRVSTFTISSLGGTGEMNSFQGSFQLGAAEGSSQSLPFSWQ